MAEERIQMVEDRQFIRAAQLGQSPGNRSLGKSGEVFSLAVSSNFTPFRH